MATEFSLGDVVKLKSGGPPMTVGGVGKNDVTSRPEAYCKWFDKDGVVQGHHFYFELIERQQA